MVAVPAIPLTTAEVAISVEPAGGSKQPTTKPIAVIPIQNG
jgi:anti-sigma-K factor RskA